MSLIGLLRKAWSLGSRHIHLDRSTPSQVADEPGSRDSQVSQRKWGGILGAIVVSAVVFRFWHLGDVALLGDEAYYWLWAEHPAFAYLDHPAGVAWMIRFSMLLAGQGEFGIRFLNAVLGVGLVFLAYAIGERLFSRRAATISAAILAVGAPYVVISRFAYTDALQLACMLLNLYLLIPFVLEKGQSPEPISFWHYGAAGLSMAILLNTKYSAYLYACSMLGILLWNRPGLLRDRRAWGGLGIALCGLIPVLAWNVAHEWASWRWQYRHFVTGALHPYSLLGNLWHALGYLTPPVAALALLGLPRFRGARRYMLLIPALVLVLPVLFSPANSPRNLVTGFALLILLAGDVIDCWMRGRFHRTWVACGLLLFLVGGYGLGTVIGTWMPTRLPQSTIAAAIRQESAGWRDAGLLDLDDRGVVFAIDYNLAALLRYYTGLPVQTSWGQYRVWGLPGVCDSISQVIALPYVDRALVFERLGSSFDEVRGLDAVRLREGEHVQVLYVWEVRGCRVDLDTFLERFDFINLFRGS